MTANYMSLLHQVKDLAAVVPLGYKQNSGIGMFMLAPKRDQPMYIAVTGSLRYLLVLNTQSLPDTLVKTP